MRKLFTKKEINGWTDTKIQDKPTDIVIQQSDCSQLFNKSTYDEMKELSKINVYNGQYCTKAVSMFKYNTALTEVNLFNTSNITDMSYMFQSCTKLVSIPTNMITGNNTSFKGTFYGCSKLTTVPQTLNCYCCTSFNAMFYDCSKLTKVPTFNNTFNVTNCKQMFYNCSKLTEVSVFNTNKVTSMEEMFYNCGQLTEIPAFKASKVTSLSGVFSRCYKLTAIHMTGMAVSFSLKDCIALEEAALVEVLNNLATVTTAQTLTLGTNLLAKLTDEEKAIATNKGWTLA